MSLMCSRFSWHQDSTYRAGSRFRQIMAMNPWFTAVGTSVMAK